MTDKRPEDMEQAVCKICKKDIIPTASMRCLDCFNKKLDEPEEVPIASSATNMNDLIYQSRAQAFTNKYE